MNSLKSFSSKYDINCESCSHCDPSTVKDGTDTAVASANSSESMPSNVSLNENKNVSLLFEFSLPSGSYATVFMRELLGYDDIL